MTEATLAAVPLAEAEDEKELGGKAVQLGEAVRAGFPVPEGVVLPPSLVEAVAADEPAAIAALEQSPELPDGPLAVRSSGLGEDSRQASFAGQHLTVLNVRSAAELAPAVADVHRSASSAAALAYRERLGLNGIPQTAVVVQRLLDPEVAGVMFTTNPISGSDERLVEASWGLGEAVVAGRVIPDSYRIARDGTVVERTAGSKPFAIRPAGAGGTEEVQLGEEEASRLCLDDAQLADLHGLAERCEEVFGPARDVEWAFAGGLLHLLQCRPATA